MHGVATPDGPLNFDELVVYDERAILPYAIVTYEYEKLGSAPAAAPAVAEEELFVVKASSEALSVMELFERNIPKSDTCSVGEAADRLRADISDALAAAAAQRDTLGTGMQSIERCVRKLHESRSAAEAQIKSTVACVRDGLVASVTAALAARESELMEALSADFRAQQIALESQRETVAARFSGQQRVCEDGAACLKRSNLEVVRLGQQMQRDISASHEVVAPIEPVRTGEIEARLQIDVTAEEAALVQWLSAFGSVGLRPPSLDAYSDMAPSYTVGKEAAGNAPQGELQSQIGKGGLQFTAEGVPEGLGIDRTTGVISGTPTTPTRGATAVVVTARNDAGESQLTLKVRVSAAERLVALGGHDGSGHLSSCEVYDPASDSWRAIAPMGSKRWGLATTVVGGLLYALGGHDGSGWLSSCEVYDPASDSWRAIAPMGSKRQGLATAVVGGLLYALGGYGDSDTGYLSSCEVYDPASDSWRAIAPMGSKRGYVATTVVGGLLYALGGYDGSGNMSSCEVYDPASDSWRAIAPMGSKRRELAAAVVGGLLYALGGYNGSGRLSSCEVFDPASDSWRAIAPMGSKRPRLAAAVVGGLLYALGGHDGSGYLSSCEVYDPASDSWRAIAPMGSKRGYVAATVVSIV
eukprot:COSAG02_NODE_348_length_24081_cov_19.231007_10_plen_641_part_00